jgi:phospholipid/cholesterol/gamma-HCH transport system permease protein
MNLDNNDMAQRDGAIWVSDNGTLHCQGDWSLRYLSSLERQIASLSIQPRPTIVCDASAIQAMDTAGAWLLRRTLERLQQKGCGIDVIGLAPDHDALMQTTAKNWPRAAALPQSARRNWLDDMAKSVDRSVSHARTALAFLGESTTCSLSLLLHLHQIRWRVLLHNLQIDGFNALPITGLLTFLMGVVIAYQGSEQLRTFGANIFIVDLVGISLLREIAPLVTAILVAGRSGSAYAAQIGTMRVTEELDALRTLGISPMSLLVLPRVLALVISLPLLTVFADMVGVLGGMLIAWNQLGITFTEFLNRFEYAIALRHFIIGVGKTPVFAVIIAMVGCYQGFQVFGGVDNVGRKTTVSVVQGIFLVIVSDAFFSILFSWWEI